MRRYKIGQQYPVYPHGRGKQLGDFPSKYDGEFVGYIQTPTESYRPKPLFAFPVFKINIVKGRGITLVALHDGLWFAAGATAEELTQDFQSKFRYVGSQWSTIRIADGISVSRDEFVKQATDAGLSLEAMGGALACGGYSMRFHKDGGEIKYCPSCKVLRHTTCCACGCGECKNCGHHWTCMPVINMPSITFQLPQGLDLNEAKGMKL